MGPSITSFKTPLSSAPRLPLNGRAVDGVQTDPQGRFWRFDVPSLQAAMQGGPDPRYS